MRWLRSERLSKLSRATLSTPALLKSNSSVGRSSSRPGSATAQTLLLSLWPQFPPLETMWPLWKFLLWPDIPQPAAAAAGGLLSFHAQLLWPGPPPLCPVLFLLLDLLQTHSWQSSPEHSRGGFLFCSVPGRFSMNRKGGQGPTGRGHRNSSTWFSYEQQKGRHAGPRHLLSSLID